MPSVEFLVPGDPTTATGGYLYDRHIVAGLEALGWAVRLRRLADSFPFPDRSALAAADRILAGFPDGALVVLDGLGLGAIPAQVEAHVGRLRLVGLVHHPLALETGLEPAQASRLYQSERRALAAVHRVLVTSSTTAAILSDYGVAPTRIGVVEPGTVARPQAHGSGSATLALLCVAAVVPRKGHEVLLDALSELKDRPWRLTCVGSLARSPRTFLALQHQLTALGLEQRVMFTGEVGENRLARLYTEADLFVLASHFEGYGMALAEAIAYGLPVVSTRAGAIPRTVPAEAALLVPPGDRLALTQALARFLDNAALRRRLAKAARGAASAMPSWPDAAARFAEELKQVLAQ